ncbi:MAG: FitA-like ribbon-helix-helix domain-containing protein [Gammaproteobacteria bacterium]
MVRNLEDEVKNRLQHRAFRHGRSMEQEVRDILRNAVRDEGRQSAAGLGSEIAALFAGNGLDADIPQLRGQSIRPADFDD